MLHWPRKSAEEKESSDTGGMAGGRGGGVQLQSASSHPQGPHDVALRPSDYESLTRVVTRKGTPPLAGVATAGHGIWIVPFGNTPRDAKQADASTSLFSFVCRLW
jgi:hypothetical protein